ncbi:MAG TPA: TonB-dependent receptor [Pricia sp.]|nr:TonB-dependent receptor [Pricia sp.]
MGHRILFFILFSGIYPGHSQAQEPRISLRIEEGSIKQALEKIEGITEYRVYYLEQWLPKDTVSGTYENARVSEVLEDVLKNTVLNFYILDKNSIILTRNKLIYDTLPQSFFGRKVQDSVTEIFDTTEDMDPVVFIKENISEKNAEIETVFIGKETIGDTKSKYTLSGYVTNQTDGKPIPNLSIISTKDHIGATTDDSGFYKILLPQGENLLETRSLGIENQKKRVIIHNDGTLDFVLDESVERLDEVIVEADAAKNVEEALTGTIDIDSEESKNIPMVLGERNILKAATALPGISTAGEGATGFNVRGGKTDQNLILLDNAVIYNPTHFFGIFQALNPFTTKNVTIYTGSIPAEYGGRLSSVFDITTKDANVNTFEGEASIGPVTGNLALEIPVIKGKSALVLGGRGTYSDWILQSLDEESLKNSKASFYDVMAKYNHKINAKNEVKLNGYYSKDQFSITSDSLYGYSNQVFSAVWNHEINPKNTGSLIVTHSGYDFEIGYDGPTTTDFDFGFGIDETGLQLKMKYLHGDTHKFTYGLSSKLYSVRPGSIAPEGAESNIIPLDIATERGLESGLFISDNFKVSDRLLLNIGVRYSMFQALGEASPKVYEQGVPKSEETVVDTLNFGSGETVKSYGGLEPRVSARYFITPDFSVKAGYNRIYQYIHTLSNNTTASPIDTWKLSDLNIKPQNADQYSLGLFKNFKENTYEVSLEGYFKKIDHILDFKTGAQLLLNKNVETEVLQGRGRAYGLEFLIRKNEGKLNGWLGYTYSRSFVKLDSDFDDEQVNNGEYFPSNYDKPHDLSITANYKFTQRFSLSANFVYQTGRPVTYPLGSYRYQDADYVFYSDRNKYRIPDYYRLDLSFNVEGNHKIKKFAHSFWNLSIYNVLGRNNPYSVFFVTENGEIKAYQSSIFSIPIPTITYNFKF